MLSSTAPSPYRLQHGRVERLAETIADDAGSPAAPYRAVDVIGQLLRRGAIDAGMAAAADEFRRVFNLAGLDPLRAADMGRTIRGMGARRHDPPTWARHHVTTTIAMLGGTKALPGSCAWHVIGCEESVRRWSTEIAGLRHDEAKGVLLATLCFIAHLGRARRRA